MDDVLGAAPIPMRALSHRVLGAAAAGLALVSTLAIGVVALSATNSHDLQPGRSSVQASPRSFGSPVPADVPPPDLDAKAVAPVVAAVPTAKQLFGKLSVTGSRDVFLDGKRLLGRGARSFTVMCGTHSIAIGVRTDAHDLDVPCNAELVVGK